MRRIRVRVKPTTFRRGGKLIHRKGYTYIRKDIGKPGRGPKLIKVKKGLLTKLGYSTSASATSRHRALTKAVKKYGAKRVWRMLHAQVVFRKRVPDHAKARFKADREWIKKTYKPDIAGPARRKWMRMSPKARAKAMPGGKR